MFEMLHHSQDKYNNKRNIYKEKRNEQRMNLSIIVEGKNDRSRLRELLSRDIQILCTYGTPGTERIEKLKRQVGDQHVYVFTDNDTSGKKIRHILRDIFPDAEQIYTRKGYAGVEGTPQEYLIQQLEKAGLEEFIQYPPPSESDTLK
jgi:toprim domain protein